MEKYEGVKFRCRREGKHFEFDDRLKQLNRWAYLLSELGLTPLHQAGASGNLSYRVDAVTFIITKSGMIPEEDLVSENYSQIIGYDEKTKTILAKGQNEPSSESVLHHLIYQTYPRIQSILHGHSNLFLRYAEALHLPVTSKFHDYGTVELASSVLDVLDEQNSFVLLKNHGFVAVGESIQLAGTLVLEKCSGLLEVLKEEKMISVT